MKCFSSHRLRRIAGASICAVLMASTGLPGRAQESKPAAPAAAESKDKPAENAAPAPADAHVSQNIQLNGRQLNYNVTIGTLPVTHDNKKIGEVVFTAYTVDGTDRPVTFAFN